MQQQQQEVIRDQTVEELINYYVKLQDEIKRLEMSKEVASEAIQKHFSEHNLREFQTATHKAYIEPRIRKSIKYEEAEAILSEDTLEKLTRESVSIVLTVRRLKSGKVL